MKPKMWYDITIVMAIVLAVVSFRVIPSFCQSVLWFSIMFVQIGRKYGMHRYFREGYLTTGLF